MLDKCSGLTPEYLKKFRFDMKNIGWATKNTSNPNGKIIFYDSCKKSFIILSK